MIPTATLATYMLVVLGLFLIPGPAVLFVLARSTGSGPRTGIATGLGIAAGDLVHTTLATFGLSAILMTSALAFSVVKYAGVAYLLYLGFRAFREKSDLTPSPPPAPSRPRAPSARPSWSKCSTPRPRFSSSPSSHNSCTRPKASSSPSSPPSA